MIRLASIYKKDSAQNQVHKMYTLARVMFRLSRLTFRHLKGSEWDQQYLYRLARHMLKQM
jgi:hypothetical protein